MPTLSITKSYADDTILTEQQLDDLKESIETFVNTTKLDADNLQNDAVGTAQLATGAVTAAKIGSSAVETAKINDAAVTTAKINDAAVTQAKMAARTSSASPGAAGTVVISGSSGSAITLSTSYVDVTDLSVTLTTVGRPVQLMLIPDGSTECHLLRQGSGGHKIYWQFMRDATVLHETDFSGSGGSTNDTLPPGCLNTVDTPAAGTYVYKLRQKTGNAGTSAGVINCKLVAFEI